MLNDYDWVHSDGYDMCASDTVLVDNCLGVTGDDVFDAKAPATNPEANITNSNSVVYSHKGCGTKVGVQCDNTVNNITFSNIDVISGYRGMSIWSWTTTTAPLTAPKLCNGPTTPVLNSSGNSINNNSSPEVKPKIISRNSREMIFGLLTGTRPVRRSSKHTVIFISRVCENSSANRRTRFAR